MLIVGEAVYVWGQGVCGKSPPSPQFCYKPNIALKIKVYFLKSFNNVTSLMDNGF